ncbi:hypothetical protein [Zhihengliuella sp.]|uniref:hypothetical protein n=1 Tax=Zhihengliuella sp. TaxID=1954483 RepID=UPI002812751B|nr:hypothetical protein [Zhihengliuella sp.]
MGALLVLTGCGPSEEELAAEASASQAAASEAAAAEASASAAAASQSAAAEASASAAAASASAAAAAAQASEEARVKAEAEAKAKAEAEAAAAEKARIDEAKPMSERDLALLVKRPDDHVDKTVVLYGHVTQFDAATGTCIFRADISHQNMADTWDYEHNSIFMAGDGDSECPVLDDVIADDQVQVTATSLGSFTYDTQIGGSTTVPMFQVERIAVVE